LKSFEPDLKLLGLAKQHYSTLVAPFESVLDLTWLPDPTTLGPAAKPAPKVFRKKGTVIFAKKHSRVMPPLPGCSQACGSAPNAQGSADPALSVCCLGSWPRMRDGTNALACQP